MRGRKKSEATRLAILESASSVFSERPYHEVLTDEISARLRVGKGTLYRYFPSKESLYFATIVHGLQGMRDAIAAVVAPQLPLEQIIENLIRTVIDYFWERRDFFVLLHRHEPKLDPSERADWQKQREELVDLVAARLAQELQRRGVSGIDSRLAVEMLFGMIRSVCMYRGDADRMDDLARQVTQIFLRGVLSAARNEPQRRAPAPRRLRAVSPG
jgi:AcrR family transcriptional regulator